MTEYGEEAGWGDLPDGWDLVEVAGVAVDASDNVFVFNRGEHPMIVLDRQGRFLRSWGEDVFHTPHGVSIGPDEHVYCTDTGDHTVRKCTPSGEVVLTLGIPGGPAPYMSGSPFRQCTHTAVTPSGHILVTDGYGNSRVHRYDSSGRLVSGWGEPGCDPGQFNIPHNICTDSEGWVYVADRENHRIQIFDGEGRYETQWTNLHRPCALFLRHATAERPAAEMYVGELGPMGPINRNVPNLGPRLTVLDANGGLTSRYGHVDGAGTGPSQFIAPHGLAVDSAGDVYVGEVSRTTWPMLYPPEVPCPSDLRTLRKLIRLPEVPSPSAPPMGAAT